MHFNINTQFILTCQLQLPSAPPTPPKRKKTPSFLLFFPKQNTCRITTTILRGTVPARSSPPPPSMRTLSGAVYPPPLCPALLIFYCSESLLAIFTQFHPYIKATAAVHLEYVQCFIALVSANPSFPGKCAGELGGGGVYEQDQS